MQNRPMKFCFFAITCFCLAACGNDKPQTNAPAAPQPAPTAPPPVVNGVFLDGLYATSAAPGREADRLFDNDAATGWQTRPGAGPDEGLMLYFSNETAQRVKFIETTPMPGSAFGANTWIQVYVNGQPAGGGKPGERIEIRQAESGGPAVNSLFLRFEDTEMENILNRTVEEDDIQIEVFPRDGFVGLQALRLLNEKDEPLHLVAPRRLPGQVNASSTLAPETAYGADNLFDARKEFAWAEGNATLAGEGETLVFSFAQPVRITAIQVWNGYQRSREHYTANARVRDFSFGAQGGPAGAYTLRDDPAGQKIALPAAASGQGFELKINTVFPGKKYKDLAISDIVFYDGQQPFVLASDRPARQQSALRAKSAASPLNDLLDRRVYNLISTPFGGTAQSLILRADGTFVLYSEAEEIDGTESVHSMAGQTIADGNWELLESNAQMAKVKVFGKWFDYAEVLEWYKGPKTREATKIFNDVLTIDAQTVRGAKMIGTFYRK